MSEFRQKAVYRNLLFIFLLTLITGAAYGIGISRLSFYGDDWIYIYNYHIAGAESFPAFTQWDRPHSAWIYILTSTLFGESPLGYHLCVFFLRWISVFLFWRMLSESFGRKRSVTAAALLFAVYPGFQQQPIAVEFVMHFSSLALLLLSLRLMQTAYFLPLKKMIPVLLLSLAAGLLSIFTCEYFIGLELSRPFILFFTVQHKIGNNRLTSAERKKSLLFLIPYLCAAVFYFVWRIFIFSFATYGPKLLTAIKENPLEGIRLLIEKILQNLVTVLFRAYRLIFSRPSSVSIYTAAIILAAISVFTFIFLHKISAEPPDSKSVTHANAELLFYGAVLFLLSGIPFWGTFLDVSVTFPWDRSTLSFSPAAAILIAAVLDAALKPVFFCIAAALFTAFSALFHLQNTQVYINETQKVNDYFWQLAWRVPALSGGTILASENIPLDRTSDNDLSPIVNWQYAPEKNGLEYVYKYFDLDLREDYYYSDPLRIMPVTHTYRSHSFNSSTEKTLGIFYKKKGCLQIIDSTNTGYPDLPESLKHISPLSDPGLILTDPQKAAEPPLAVGKEPEHGYCYYFQKTALALQMGDSHSAYEYAKQVLSSEFQPVYASDLGPIILAFLSENDFNSAEQMISSVQIGQQDREYLCSYWQNSLTDQLSAPGLQDFYRDHGCF